MLSLIFLMFPLTLLLLKNILYKRFNLKGRSHCESALFVSDHKAAEGLPRSPPKTTAGKDVRL